MEELKKNICGQAENCPHKEDCPHAKGIHYNVWGEGIECKREPAEGLPF